MAQLAGVPASVIRAARARLAELERGQKSEPAAAPGKSPAQPDLFSQAVSAVETRLDQIDPDELSPKDALALLYELKALR